MNETKDQQFKTSLTVTGMTCATCSRMVERSLKKVDGVVFYQVLDAAALMRLAGEIRYD